MIGKTKTALEAGSFGNRGLGMPGPVGTRGRGLALRSTGSEAGRRDCAGKAWEPRQALP